MKTNALTSSQPGEGHGFDLARLSKSKQAVDVCSNTIRSYARRGLPLYRQGKAVFFSKGELAAFIRTVKV